MVNGIGNLSSGTEDAGSDDAVSHRNTHSIASNDEQATSRPPSIRNPPMVGQHEALQRQHSPGITAASPDSTASSPSSPSESISTDDDFNSDTETDTHEVYADVVQQHIPEASIHRRFFCLLYTTTTPTVCTLQQQHPYTPRTGSEPVLSPAKSTLPHLSPPDLRRSAGSPRQLHDCALSSAVRQPVFCDLRVNDGPVMALSAPSQSSTRLPSTTRPSTGNGGVLAARTLARSARYVEGDAACVLAPLSSTLETVHQV